MGQRTFHYTEGDTNEHVVFAGRCRLIAVRPNLVTTGTVTLRNAGATGGSAVFSLSAIGLPQAGKSFDEVVLDKGLTVQLSAATDLCTIIYEPF